MSTAALAPSDKQLYDIVNGPSPVTIADVIARMQTVDDLLPTNDGLKWFNQLYWMVTEQVDLHPPNGAWQNAAWLTRLDIVFANLYFGAVKAFIEGGTVPWAWNVFFGARFGVGIDRIQFALAGMNAHINHDLALALLTTDAALSLIPAKGGPEFADYESVNSLLKTVMPSALTMLATDTLGVLAQDTGKIGRVLAFWDICSARDLAWDFADHLRGLSSIARDVALSTQDRLTGALGRAILSA
jgi:hypothetical protein